MAAAGQTASRKILRNSFWYGLETILETIVFLGTSIAVARYLGPAKLGYYSYIAFFVAIVTRTSGTGLASATRKYMSEFLALEKPGTARAVYHLAYRYQLLGAALITVLGLAAVLLFGDPRFKLMSSLLILSIIPGVMSWVPAQANQAFEDVSQNTFSALGYLAAYTLVVLLTLHFGWDLVGVASATLIGRSVEVVWRTIPLHARLQRLPLDPLELDVVARIRTFCLQAIGIQLLASLVWDRSEMIFLKSFSSLDQVAFYSVSFGFAANLLLVPRTFVGAAGISLMVEAGRDPERIDSIVKNACRYLLLVVFPVHLGAAAITRQAIHFTYGARYAGAVPVLIVASLLAMPRAFQEIPETLLRTADKQKRLLYLLLVTGVLNIALDWALIPRFGAIGAAWANGIAQAIGISATWQQARRLYTFSLPLGSTIRLGVAGLVMAGVAYLVVNLLPGALGLVAAVVSAIPIYVLLVRVVDGLEPADRARLSLLAERLPSGLRQPFMATVSFVTATSVS